MNALNDAAAWGDAFFEAPVKAGHCMDAPASAPDKPLLLVVDDHPMNIQVMYHLLQAHYRIAQALGGADAVRLAHELQPDLILMDIAMPDVDGLETCQILKGDAQTRDIPVIFITSHVGQAAEAAGLEVGAVDFITKPFHPAIVKARVKTQVTLKRQADLLRQLAMDDALTGLANRRAFEERLQMECRRARRSGDPLALALIDIDGFGRFNQTHGHALGDALMVAVGRTLSEQLMRAGDLMARWAGGSFACLLPGADAAGAQEIAERLRGAVWAMQVPQPNGGPAAPGVSVSMGVVGVPASPGGPNGGWQIDPARLIEDADALLLQAKHGGGDRVCHAQAMVERAAVQPELQAGR